MYLCGFKDFLTSLSSYAGFYDEGLENKRKRTL
ncbi:MAG: hypothetical protein H6R34_316 [Bacteroidetes bacterium]|nr:hypothetical protein [Bacteroidota bacterium]